MILRAADARADLDRRSACFAERARKRAPQPVARLRDIAAAEADNPEGPLDFAVRFGQRPDQTGATERPTLPDR